MRLGYEILQIMGSYSLQWKMYITAQHSTAQAGAADAFVSLHQNKTALATEVSAINNAVQTDGFVAENEKLYNSIYQQTKMQGRTNYTAEEWSAIEYLSFQCPLQGGRSVYLARTLYRLQKDTVFEDANLCAAQQIAYKKDNSDTVQIIAARQQERKQPQVKVYPNPAQNKLFVEIRGDVYGEFVFVLIHDVTGKLIKASNISCKGNFVLKEYMLEDFANGIYYVSVSDEKINFRREKIIISK